MRATDEAVGAFLLPARSLCRVTSLSSLEETIIEHNIKLVWLRAVFVYDSDPCGRGGRLVVLDVCETHCLCRQRVSLPRVVEPLTGYV